MSAIPVDSAILVAETAAGGYGYCFERALAGWGVPTHSVGVPGLWHAPLLMTPPLLHANRLVTRVATHLARHTRRWVIRRVAQSMPRRCVSLIVGIHPIDRDSLRLLRERGPVVLFFNDDLETRRGRPPDWWKWARPLLDAADLLVTQRPHREQVIRRHYSGEILFQDFAYMEMFHRPYTGHIHPRWTSDLGFIGNFDPDRFPILRRLAESQFRVGVWGVHWPRDFGYILHGYVGAADSPRALAASTLALGLVRRNNYDYQVMRTFEIPACAAFLLTERTPDHERLFREGQEAEFFSDEDELLSKARFYLHHHGSRERIAKAGYRRIVSGSNTVADRLAAALAHPVVTSGAQMVSVPRALRPSRPFSE